MMVTSAYVKIKTMKRLDAYLAERNSESRSLISKYIEQGLVRVNGRVVTKPSHKVAEHDVVEMEKVTPVAVDLVAEPLPEGISLRRIYEDEDLLVIDKPRGMVVHPSKSHESGTLVHYLMGMEIGLSGIGGELRPGIVHRLDKDTSGLLLIAKNDEAHRALSKQLELAQVERVYVAIVRGILTEDGTIDRPLGRDPKNRLKMAVVRDGKRAVTRYRVIETFRKHSYVQLHLETGRTHQIRVHMASIGHPVLCDPVYGTEEIGLRQVLGYRAFSGAQILHAKQLGFRHPRTGEPLLLESPIPYYFEMALEAVRMY